MNTLTNKQRAILNTFRKNKKILTYSQRSILKRAEEKIFHSLLFQDRWVDYEESYGTDYNDCHGDYYDAEANN